MTDFDFDLPAQRIAQRPAARRDRARLLVLDRASGEIGHRRFDEIGQLLRRGDLLVLNDTRVEPARLLGHKSSGGRVELLLIERLEGRERPATWRCLLQAARPPTAGARITLEDGLEAEVLGRDEEGWLIRMHALEGSLEELLARVGRVPLPPYIRREDGVPPPVDDRERYQTVYARHPGAVAAPTAGLHFTDELLDELRGRGIEQAFLTLHVGPGTFLPLRVEQVEEHRMHEESFELPEAAAAAIDRARDRGGRVVAVGTTVVRTLESCSVGGGRVAPRSGRCGLFIYPGFRFTVVDALLTNFHLPRSTLLMLVCAFAGRERVLAAYGEAIAAGYRFYSYGDAMWIGAR